MTVSARRPAARLAARSRRIVARARTGALSLTTALALVAGTGAVFLALPTPAAHAADRGFTQRFSVNDTGDLTIVGTTVMTCPDSSPGCLTARNAGPRTTQSNGVNNNAFPMTYVDVDSDPDTFDSSTATLDLPDGAQVLFAGLYWGGEVEAGANGLPAPDREARGTVLLDAPGEGGYRSVKASSLDDGLVIYQGFADVTQQVQDAGAGAYTVANVQAATGNDRLGGWSLVVAYHDPAQPARNLTVFDGLTSIDGTNPGQITVDGFQTPSSGPVRSTVGFVTYEGDLGLVGDAATLNGLTLADAQHPSTNFFDSRSSRDGALVGGSDPAYPNGLGYEHAQVSVGNTYIGNGDTSATIRLSTAGDVYAPGVVTFATELYSPAVTQDVTVQDLNGGVVEQGDRLRYTVHGVNTGEDAADQLVVRDPVPTDTTYVPGSLQVAPIGTAAAPATDPSGDDAAEYDAVDNRIVARLGAGADASVGGRLAPGDDYTLVFDVTVNGPEPALADGTTLTDRATASFVSSTLGTPFTVVSSVDTVVATADLRLAKTHTGSIVRGAPVTYRLAVRNVGHAGTQGVVTLSDPLPDGLTYQDASGIGWDCAPVVDSGRPTVVCTTSDRLEPGGTYPPVLVTARVADAAPDAVANTGTVVGGGDGVPDDNSSTDSAPTVAITDLVLAKTASPTVVPVGGTTDFALTVRNQGPSTSSGSTVVDTLPAGLTFVSADAACSADATGSQVSCEVGTLAVGRSATLRVTARAALGTAGSTQTNTAVVTARQPDPDLIGNAAKATVTVRPVDLAVTDRVEGAPASLTAGTTYAWLLDARNLGGSPAADSVLRFSLPTGVSVAASSLDSRCTLDGATDATRVTCVLGTVAAGATVPTIRVVGTLAASASAPGTVDSTATVGTSEPDADLSNNTASTSTPITAVAAPRLAGLSVTKTVDKPTARSGDTLTWTLVAANAGPAAAENVMLSDRLPAGVTVTSVTSAAGAPSACTRTATTISCPQGTLAVGAKRVVVVKATVDALSATDAASHALVTSDVETKVSVPAGTIGQATATCPAGSTVVDGSVRLDSIDTRYGSLADAGVLVSTPTSDGTGWSGRIRNPNRVSLQGAVVAVCLTGSTSTREARPHTLPASSVAKSSVAWSAGTRTSGLDCPTGRLPIAPGWSLTGGPGKMRTSQPGTSDWGFGSDVPSGTASFTASLTVRCLGTTVDARDGHAHALRTRTVGGTFRVAPGRTSSAALTCPTGSTGVLASWTSNSGLVFLGDDPRDDVRVFTFANPTWSYLDAQIALRCLDLRTGAGYRSTTLVNTAIVSTTTPDATTADDQASATTVVDDGAGTGTGGWGGGTGGTGGSWGGGGGCGRVVAGTARGDALRVHVTSARTGTVRLRVLAADAGSGVRRGTVLADRRVRFAAGARDVSLQVRDVARAAVRDASIRRVTVELTLPDGGHQRRTVRLT
ncbi:DUF11 domain-containing protein [Nocardioides sp. TRM66260-LWL]|uniref:DUF11 domain-containing protein n=1 Tax=Nocardioides sp. TRM66260-LWL TaxID=2874478 RepID=UPI001CC57C0B|nr:DUF11 domain-containing protein [Nocardioides sp. TRM66260-LWL]MBZ5733409.1 DUF11 domain-containing protein [Nocardioides sp. TRM66260-LWL]